MNNQRNHTLDYMKRTFLIFLIILYQSKLSDDKVDQRNVITKSKDSSHFIVFCCRSTFCQCFIFSCRFTLLSPLQLFCRRFIFSRPFTLLPPYFIDAASVFLSPLYFVVVGTSLLPLKQQRKYKAEKKKNGEKMIKRRQKKKKKICSGQVCPFWASVVNSVCFLCLYLKIYITSYIRRNYQTLKEIIIAFTAYLSKNNAARLLNQLSQCNNKAIVFYFSSFVHQFQINRNIQRLQKLFIKIADVLQIGYKNSRCLANCL